jgi:hypothetical protein
MSGSGGGVAAAGVADLGQESGSAHGARSGQGGEDRGVGMLGELDSDLLFQSLGSGLVAR